MTPDKALQAQQEQFDTLIDDLILEIIPKWSTLPSQADLRGGENTAGEIPEAFKIMSQEMSEARTVMESYQKALRAYGEASRSFEVREDCLKRADALPGQYAFLLQTLMAHQGRRQGNS